MSIHPRTKSNYRREKDPSRGQNLDSDSWMTYVEKILFETVISKYVYFDTMIDFTVKKREQRIGIWNIQYCERESVQHLKSNWKEEFTSEDWSHRLYRRSFKCVNWSILVQSEDHKRIIPPRMMSYAKIPYQSTIHLFRGSSTRSLLYCRSWTRSKKKRKKKVVRRMYTDVHTHTEGRQTFSLQWGSVRFVSTTMPAKQKQLQIQRSRGRWIIKFIDDLSQMQSTEFIAIITNQSLRWKNAL